MLRKREKKHVEKVMMEKLRKEKGVDPGQQRGDVKTNKLRQGDIPPSPKKVKPAMIKRVSRPAKPQQVENDNLFQMEGDL